MPALEHISFTIKCELSHVLAFSFQTFMTIPELYMYSCISLYDFAPMAHCSIFLLPGNGLLNRYLIEQISPPECHVLPVWSCCLPTLGTVH